MMFNRKSADTAVSLKLGLDGLQVLDEDGKKTLQSASYDAIIGLFHS